MPRDSAGKVIPGSYGPGNGGAFSNAVSGARAGADAALGPEPIKPDMPLTPEDKEVVDIINDPNTPKQEKLAKISQLIDRKEAGGESPVGPPPGGPPMGPSPGGPPMGLPQGPIGGM